MNEYERIISRYFDNKDKKVYVYYDYNQEELYKLIENLRPYEKPDMISLYDNKIIAIEHFEFDSFKNFSKGSDFQRKESLIKKRFDEKVKNELLIKKNIKSTETLIITATLKNYYKNFIKVFKSHYDKLSSYKEHINKDFDCNNKETEYWFFIEDESPLGSYYLNSNRQLMLLNPLFSNEIKELLKQCNNIKGIFFGQYAMNEYRLSLIINSEETFKIFDNEKPTIDEKDFFSFEPQTTGFATLISKESEGVENNE